MFCKKKSFWQRFTCTAEENYFENHAVENHPLSAVLFEKTKTIRNNEVNIKEEIVDNVDHFIVGDIKKEPSEIINDAKNDPFYIRDPQYSIHQERENLTIPVDPSLLYTEESEPMEPKSEPNEQSELQVPVTGKSLSEALIFASTNPQYDDFSLN